MAKYLYVFCAAVLILNDHVLKKSFHNALTGKLSDIVGAFVLYRLLRGVGKIGLKPWPSFWVVIGFCLLIKSHQKMADVVAQYTCGLFFEHCHFIADPYDLLAFIPFIVFFLSVGYKNDGLGAVAK